MVGSIRSSTPAADTAFSAHDRLTPLLFDEHAPGFRAKRHTNNIGNGRRAAQNFLSSLGSEHQVLVRQVVLT
jgi:hypothetical protein